jgi:hypothetical protein
VINDSTPKYVLDKTFKQVTTSMIAFAGLRQLCVDGPHKLNKTSVKALIDALNIEVEDLKIFEVSLK